MFINAIELHSTKYTNTNETFLYYNIKLLDWSTYVLQCVLIISSCLKSDDNVISVIHLKRIFHLSMKNIHMLLHNKIKSRKHTLPYIPTNEQFNTMIVSSVSQVFSIDLNSPRNRKCFNDIM